MITGRVVVGLPLNLFSVRWKYSCMALLAGISSFYARYVRKGANDFLICEWIVVFHYTFCRAFCLKFLWGGRC